VTVPSGTLWLHCLLNRLFNSEFLLILYWHNCNILVEIHFKICRHINSLIQNNFLRSLAQIRERGIQSRLYQKRVSSKEPREQPSIMDVSMVTVAPILVVLAAGYATGIFVLLIELCLNGNLFKFWPRRSVRRLRQN
jgi:hypothetical protein